MHAKFDLMYLFRGRLERLQLNFLDFKLWKIAAATIFKMAPWIFFCEYLRSRTINVVRQIFLKAFSFCAKNQKPVKLTFCHNSPPDGAIKNQTPSTTSFLHTEIKSKSSDFLKISKLVKTQKEKSVRTRKRSWSGQAFRPGPSVF